MTVSVIIVNWRTPDALRGCIESVQAQVRAPARQIIVVDNASGDGSAEMVAERFPDAHLIANDENSGFAVACNQGMGVATGEFVLLLNPDTVVPPETLATVLEFAEKRPDAAVIGCRVINADGSLERTCFRFPSLLNIVLSASCLNKFFPRNRFFGREFMGWWDRNTERDVDVVTGSFMLVRRQAIDQIGLMDERYFMYVEEADWCYRFAQAGWKATFTPIAHIVHLSSRSSNQCWPKMYVWQNKSVLLFLEKWHGKTARRAASFVLALSVLPRAAFWWFAKTAGLARERAASQSAATAAALRFHLTGAIPD
jgi:hypothetical protein